MLLIEHAHFVEGCGNVENVNLNVGTMVRGGSFSFSSRFLPFHQPYLRRSSLASCQGETRAILCVPVMFQFRD